MRGYDNSLNIDKSTQGTVYAMVRDYLCTLNSIAAISTCIHKNVGWNYLSVPKLNGTTV